MKQQSKQNSQEQERLAATQAQQLTPRQFATSEELLRHDAEQAEVPPVVAERLNKSIQGMPRPSRSWWQRLLKR